MRASAVGVVLLASLMTAFSVISLVACTTGQVDPASGDWQGTITTEGNVTTVVNESGSVWGGRATLVEEASIGAESGAEEYIFGRIGSIYATNDRIYVADDQVPAVRAYDHAGTFVQNFGREGQGPGEYTYPSVVAADASGRVFVQDPRNARINVYTADGEILDTWPFASAFSDGRRMYPLSRNVVWASVNERVDEFGFDIVLGAQEFGPEGALGDPLWLPEIEYERTTFETASGFEEVTPFSANLAWSPAPDGKLVVGASDRYRFDVHGRRGAELVVERYWEPVRVHPEHKEWERQREIVFQREVNHFELNLSSAQIPDHTAAFVYLVPTLSGETWVVRRGASERLPDCPGDPSEVGHRTAQEQPCWTSRPIVDVFGADGRYLGEVEWLEGVETWARSLAVDGRCVVAEYQDEAGTIMVKRYRLVLPGEE